MFYWVLLGFTVFYFFLLLFTGFHWVLLGFTGFYWVLPGFTGFYRVLLGFTGFYCVLLDFTGFQWTWLGFTEFYWVLPSFTGFYRVLLWWIVCLWPHGSRFSTQRWLSDVLSQMTQRTRLNGRVYDVPSSLFTRPDGAPLVNENRWCQITSTDRLMSANSTSVTDRSVKSQTFETDEQEQTFQKREYHWNSSDQS